MNPSTDWQEAAMLVGQAQRGDEEAFRQLLLAHRDVVASTLMACGVRSTETARDLAQEVALRVWTHLGDLREARTFRAWIRRIAANAARDHLRRMAVRREESLDAALDLAGDEDPHLDAQRMAEIRLMLAALDFEDQETVELLVARAEGTPVDDLAARVGASSGALKMRLVRARRRLQKRLGELDQGDPA